MLSCSPMSRISLLCIFLVGCQTALPEERLSSPGLERRPPEEQIQLALDVRFAEQDGIRARGTITIQPGGQVCPPACSAVFPRGRTISLTAAAGPNSFFSGWDQPCLGGNPYPVTLDHDVTLTAAFAPEMCSANFCWENPRPQGNSLRMIRGDGQQALIAVGEFGTVIRFGDRLLSAEFLPGPDKPSPANPRAVPESLLAVHVFSARNFWAAGGEHLPEGVIHHFDADHYQSWRGLSGELWGLYGATPSDIWATGYPGAILHYQGERWDVVEKNSDPDPVARWHHNLLRVTGTAPGMLWAGGRRQISLRRFFQDDPSKPPRWNAPDPTVQALTFNPALGLSASLVDLWGQGEDLFAIGTEAAILHYRSGTWQRYDHQAKMWSTSPSDPMPNLTLIGIYGSGPKDVWAVGNRETATAGVFLHYDGTRWTDALLTGGPAMQSVYTSGPGAPVWMVGTFGNISCFHAGILRTISDGVAQDIRGLLSLSQEEALAVGRNGLIMYRHNGVWQRDNESWQPASPAPDLNALAYAQDTGELFIVGNNATILRGHPMSWKQEQLMEYVVRRDQHLHDISLAENGTAYVAGTQGILARYTPGLQPEPAEKLPCPPSGVAVVDLYGVATAPDGEVVAVGQAGTVWRFAGGVCQDWSLPKMGAQLDLYAVQRGPDGEWWIAGDGGTLLRRKAGGWSAIPDPQGLLNRVNLKKLLTRGDELWAIGGVPRPTLSMLMSPAGPPEGVVLRIRGDAIEVLKSGTHNELRAISGQKTSLWVGGLSGTILRLRP